MGHRFSTFRVASAAVAWCMLCAAAGGQQSAARTVWDGVYTAAQAERGKAAYQEKCAACHKNDLSGYESALKGDRFLRHWSEDSLESFYRITKSTMPRGAPESLEDTVYVDIVTFILEANGFPSGREELTAGALRDIRVESKSGPAELPAGALVSVVGCLAEGPGNTWTLAQAGRMVRTRNGGSYTEEDLKALEETPLGRENIGLMDADFYELGSKKAHKVAVKGLLIRSNGVRINVTTLQDAGSNCGA
jgi:mono/diheme cytochrome c family protein